MAEKRIIGRAIQKHDIEAHWNLATNFVPMAGEIIIYDKDSTHNYVRVKVGDGETVVTALPFVDDTKVDKVSGKGLSTNDYTTTEKNKLAGIATGANKTTVDSALSSTSTNPVQNKVINTAISNLNTLVGDTSVSAQIETAIADKVDKVSGKGLSTNDYTTNEKNKLSGIATGAEVNQNAFSNVVVGSTTIAADAKTDTLTIAAGDNVTITADATNDKVTIAAKDTTYSAATTSAAGLMSAADKTKLDGIATKANKTTVDSALSSTSTNPVQNKVVNAAINEINTLIGDEPVATQINNAIESKADKEHTHDTLYVDFVSKLPSAEYWLASAYGNGKFITVAPYTNKAAYSMDGINWTGITLPLSENWTSITYGSGQFVLIAANTTNMLFSSDGLTWRTGRMPSSDVWVSVACDDSCFIAIASGTSRYAYSYGGSSWSYDDFPISAEWSDITYDGNKFIVTAAYNSVVLSGFTYNWTQNSNNTNAYSLTKVASNGSGYSVAIASQYGGEACWSSNGTTWNSVSVAGDVLNDIAYGNNKFVIVGSGEKAFYSSDGKTWKQSVLPGSLAWNSVVYGDGKFVAIASSSVISAISYDGITWIIKESSMLDKNGNNVVPQVGGLLSEWTTIYDSGEISSDVNAFSGIDISGYKHIMVAIKCVNTTKSIGGISGAIVFKGQNGGSYPFKNILPNLIKNTSGTSGGMAIFQVVNGFIVCENAMRAQSAEHMLYDTEGYGADNLTPVGGGIIKCLNNPSTLMVSNANLSTSYYYGAGSRVIVWGCRV